MGIAEKRRRLEVVHSHLIYDTREAGATTARVVRLISGRAAHTMAYSLMKHFYHRETAFEPSNLCWALAFLRPENRSEKIVGKGIAE